jgi:hypothetical protein
LAYSDEDATKFIVVADNLDDTYFVLYAEELRIYYSDSDGSFNVSCCYDSNSNNESATFIDAGATEVSGYQCFVHDGNQLIRLFIAGTTVQCPLMCPSIFLMDC